MLGPLLPDVFTGADGDELLGLQFADLMSPKAADAERHAAQQGGGDDHLQEMADAARSMLAALEPDAPAGQVGWD